MPPHLAGREAEHKEFEKLLEQDTILENLILTGLRGVGKTVLLETFKPTAISRRWLWAGTDLSESSSISESKLAMRLMTDLSVVTSSLVIATSVKRDFGFSKKSTEVHQTLTFHALAAIYDASPGLVADKLKVILEVVWAHLQKQNARGLIFAYDEAQNLADHPGKEEFALSLLLDVFQSIQRKNIPFMLVLTGLPTLFPKLVEARTFAERMFRVLFLDRLSDDESREAILKPINVAHCPVRFSDESVETITDDSGGYPYFIQFICREVFDVFIQQMRAGEDARVPAEEIMRKLDSDFFAGRWARATDRQRELLIVVAMLENSDKEFTVQEVVEESREILQKPFSNSHASQMLSSLTANGLIYKNRYGKYSLAVPLLDQFIRRQLDDLKRAKVVAE